MILFQDGPSGHAVIEAYDPGLPAHELAEIARLLVRIAPSPARSSTPIALGKALYFGPSREIELEAESGGYEGARLFAPVEEWTDGLLEVVSRPDAFLRGDANQDRTINLSDAVSILNYLFLGNGGATCLAAVDVNDDDAVVISDAIFLLGTLFLGVGTIPPPYPACGLDANQSLSCEGPTSCS